MGAGSLPTGVSAGKTFEARHDACGGRAHYPVQGGGIESFGDSEYQAGVGRVFPTGVMVNSENVRGSGAVSLPEIDQMIKRVIIMRGLGVVPYHC